MSGFLPILSSSFLKRASHSLQRLLERLPTNFRFVSAAQFFFIFLDVLLFPQQANGAKIVVARTIPSIRAQVNRCNNVN